MLPYINAVQSVSKCGHKNSQEDYLTMVFFTMLYGKAQTFDAGY